MSRAAQAPRQEGLNSDEEALTEIDKLLQQDDLDSMSEDSRSSSSEDEEEEEELPDHDAPELLEEIDTIMGKTAAEAAGPNSQGSYKRAINSFKNKAARELRNVPVDSLRHMLVFIRWGEHWCKIRARGHSHVQQVFYGLQWDANREGRQNSWTFKYHDRTVRWLRGLKAAQKRDAMAMVSAKSKTVFPASFIVAIIAQCVRDNMEWLAIVFHILFVGGFRHEHVGFFLKRDVFIPEDGRSPAEVWLGGLKTENSMEKGGWLKLPGLDLMMLRRHLAKLKHHHSSLFPSYTNSYTLKYLQTFANKVQYLMGGGIVVHALRGSGAQYLESLGYKQEEVHRQCRWTPNSTVAGVSYLSAMDPSHRQALQEWMPTPFSGKVMVRTKKLPEKESPKVLEALTQAIGEVKAMTKLQFHAYRIRVYARLQGTQKAMEDAEVNARMCAAPVVTYEKVQRRAQTTIKFARVNGLISPEERNYLLTGEMPAQAAPDNSDPQRGEAEDDAPKFERPNGMITPEERAWLLGGHRPSLQTTGSTPEVEHEQDSSAEADEGIDPIDLAKAAPMCLVCGERVFIPKSECLQCSRPIHRKKCAKYNKCPECRERPKKQTA